LGGGGGGVGGAVGVGCGGKGRNWHKGELSQKKFSNKAMEVARRSEKGRSSTWESTESREDHNGVGGGLGGGLIN